MSFVHTNTRTKRVALGYIFEKKCDEEDEKKWNEKVNNNIEIK